jgi:ketosteroid isomerase-like protein
MSQENVELAYRITDAFNRRDLDAYLALTDEDVVEGNPRFGAMEGGYHGHDGTRRLWTDFLAVFPDFSLEFDEVYDIGENVTLAVGRARGHGAGSDTPIEQAPSCSPLGAIGSPASACIRRGRTPLKRGAVGARRPRRLVVAS